MQWYRNPTTLSIWTAHSMMGMGAGFQNALLSLFLSSMGYQTVAIGLILSVRGLPRALMNFLGGWLADRFSRKINFLLGIFVSAVATPFLLSIAWGWEVVAVALILSGLAISWQMTAAISWFGDITPGKLRGTVLGIDLACIWIGITSGAMIGAILASLVGFRLTFQTAAIIGVSSVLLTIFKAREIKAKKSGPENMPSSSGHQSGWKLARSVWTSPTMLAISYGGLLTHIFSEGLVKAILPLVIVATKIGGLLEVGAIASAYSLLFSLAQPIGGNMSDRIGRRPIITIGFGGTAVFSLLAYWANGFWPLFALMALTGFSLGTTYPSMEALAVDLSPKEVRARGVGFWRFWRDIGDTIGPPLLAVAATLIGALSIFYVTSALSFVGVALVFHYARAVPDKIDD